MIIIEESGTRVKIVDHDTIKEILRALDPESAQIAKNFLKEQRRAARSYWFSDWLGIVAQVGGIGLMVLGAMYLIAK